LLWYVGIIVDLARDRHAPRPHRNEPGDHDRQAGLCGTRIPVELVLRKLGAGMPPEAILADHPRLTLEDIDAVRLL
jgi:hypothetical protein